MRWAGYVARVEDSGKAYKVLVENPEGIIPVGRSRRTWDDGSEIDVKETRVCAWTGLIWLMIGTNSGLL